MAITAKHHKLPVSPEYSARVESIVSTAVEQYAQLRRAYMEASDDVRAVIDDMCEIITDPTVDHDDRVAAISTLVEALFPISHNGELGIDIAELRNAGFHPNEAAEVEKIESEEATFAQRLKALMAEKKINQDTLASLTGVQQPAISMMLARDCRPQRRTVEKIAHALGVTVEQLWGAS